MKCKFNVALQFENENTGEIIRNFKVDIYIDTLDECSMDYLKECVSSACRDVMHIINDI